ncbi:MAG: AI-2E family transporter [Bdellovibrionales bacterium]|nr:AI-2E family transporter [Bdellovibrionales bacterium]
MSKTKINMALKLLIVIVLVFSVVVLISPFLLSLAIGGLLSVVVFPIYMLLIRKKWNQYFAAFIAVTVFNLVFLIPTTVVILKGAAATVKFVNHTLADKEAVSDIISGEREKLEKAQVKVTKYTQNLGIDIPHLSGLVKNATTTIGNFLVDIIKKLFSQIPELFLALFVITLTMFFSLIEHKKIKNVFLDHCLLDKTRGEKLVKAGLLACKSVILANVIAGGVQALIVAAGAYFTSTGDFFIVVFVTFLLSFVPVIGAAPVAFILASLAGLNHNYSAAVIMAIVGITAGISDNFIRPMVLSEAAETHALLNLLTILGGIILFGLPGLFIGPLILSLAVSCIPIYKEEIDI